MCRSPLHHYRASSGFSTNRCGIYTARGTAWSCTVRSMACWWTTRGTACSCDCTGQTPKAVEPGMPRYSTMGRVELMDLMMRRDYVEDA